MDPERWNSTNSNFWYKEYIPFLPERQNTIILQDQGDAAVTLTVLVLGFTQEPQVLREEYDNYALGQFVSPSTWEQIRDTIGNAEQDTYILALLSFVGIARVFSNTIGFIRQRKTEKSAILPGQLLCRKIGTFDSSNKFNI